MNRKKNSGFSLVELIVVIAIMAVLVGILAPSYLKYVEKSREGVCQTNRDTLRQEILVEAIADADISGLTGIDFTNRVDPMVNTYICPSDKTKKYYVAAENTEEPASINNFTVKCRIHPKSAVSLGNKDNMSTILAAITGISVADSNAYGVEGLNGDTTKIINELKKQSIDLNALGAETWKYSNSSSNQSFCWTTVDITNLAAGTEIPVIKYNFAEGPYKGMYTVWTATVADSKNGNTPYKLFNITGSQYTGNGANKDENKTYEKALQYLKELQELINAKKKS